MLLIADFWNVVCSIVIVINLRFREDWST